MDTKISAMPPLTQVENSDIVPVVHAGVNFSATKELMLSAVPSEGVHLQQQTNRAGWSPIGDFEIIQGTSGSFVIALNSGFDFTVDGGGNLDMHGIGFFNISDSIGPIIQCSGALPVFVRFHGGSASDWQGATPIDMTVAILRLAAFVRNLHGPIP